MLKIRKVIKEDSDLLLSWRNNPEVYKYALNPAPVAPGDHVNWFEKTLKDPRCVFYMGMMDGVPCGSVRYQLAENLTEAEVSISVAPEFWGKGVASSMMAQAEIELKKETKVNIIHAVVLNENEASLKLFNKANFKPALTKFKKHI